jgi:predicted nucleotidyltransferase
MRLEHVDEKIMKKKIFDVIARNLDIDKYRVFAFGSRVSGRGDERSDIDVGIEGSEALPAGALGTIRDAMEELDTLYKIDVVDFSDVSPKFKAVAKRYIEMISSPSIAQHG